MFLGQVNADPIDDAEFFSLPGLFILSDERGYYMNDLLLLPARQIFDN
jgi:hypothetical protein